VLYQGPKLLGLEIAVAEQQYNSEDGNWKTPKPDLQAYKHNLGLCVSTETTVYFKRGLQPKCGVQNEICGVQNRKLVPWGTDGRLRLSDLDLGSGHTAHCRASLIDLYLRTKFHWDRKKNFFESHHW